MKNLNFSDGLEEYRLNDRITVRFNPTDVSFLEKLAAAFERMDALQEEIRAAGESLTEEQIFPFARAQDAKMRECLDSLFDVPVCGALFGPVNLYASAGGFPLWANLLVAVSEEVEASMQSELRAREKRIAKYTAKYQAPLPSRSGEGGSPQG